MKLVSEIPTLKSDRLLLLNSTQDILEAILKEGNFISTYLDVSIPDQWTEFGIAPFEYALKKIMVTPGDANWWNWLPILVSENILIGNCGYKGPPKEGAVEIGYEVAAAYRHRGFATEIATVLVKNAFSYPMVDTIIAHTLAEENASVRVLGKCGFQFAGSVEDPEDGLVWKWVIKR